MIKYAEYERTALDVLRAVAQDTSLLREIRSAAAIAILEHIRLNPDPDRFKTAP